MATKRSASTAGGKAKAKKPVPKTKATATPPKAKAKAKAIAKATAKATAPPRAPSGIVAPLPALVRHEHDWRGVARFPAWSGLRFYSKWMKRSPKPDDGTVDLVVEARDGEEIGAGHARTYEYLAANEVALADLVLRRIVEMYPDAKRIYQESVDESWPKLPDVRRVKDLGAVIGPPTIHVYANVHAPDAVGSISFAFDCAWDEEHQLGVLTHDGEIVEVGGGDVAGFIVE